MTDGEMATAYALEWGDKTEGDKAMNDYVYLTSFTWDLSYNISVPLNSFYY